MFLGAQVAAHVEGGPERRYPAQQLLRLVPGLDLADGVGRQVAVNLLIKLLSQPPAEGSYACGGDERWERALATAARHVFPSLEEFQGALLEVSGIKFCLLVPRFDISWWVTFYLSSIE